MPCSSRALRRARLGVIAAILALSALSLAACGGPTTTESGSPQNSSPTDVASPSGSGTSTTDSLAISGTPPANLVTGHSYAFTPTTAGGSANALSFTIVNMPSWASFDSRTGRLSGTPTSSSVGTYANIQLSVSDGQATATLPAFSINVRMPLAISGSPETHILDGSRYAFVPTPSAAAGAALSFTIQNRPRWASFNHSTGELSGIATETGTFRDIIISVSDGSQSSSLAAFSITVSARGSGGGNGGSDSPSISGNPPTGIVAGSLYSFTPAASDPAGHALTFSIRKQPSWASFSPSSGTLRGTPTIANAGSYPGIVISASNGTKSASLTPFSIRVTVPLTISGSPAAQAAAGKSYSFQPTTNAPNGSALTFSIQNRPAWASFMAGTGLLSGTPAASQSGTYSGIVISVSDGSQSVALAPFSITVQKGLAISGNPPTSVNAGSAYRFTPAASAPNGAAVTFSIQNQPPWASFNAASGTLAGTPGAADVGTYSNIVISVSSGGSSASLPAFGISVNQVSNGTASLNWTPVISNTNGTVLSDLAGYRVHYGTSPNDMNTVVTLSNPSLTNYLVTNLSSGTWYFGLTAYTRDGVESSLSNIGHTTIP